jgi:hypothetical protein
VQESPLTPATITHEHAPLASTQNQAPAPLAPPPLDPATVPPARPAMPPAPLAPVPADELPVAAAPFWAELPDRPPGPAAEPAPPLPPLLEPHAAIVTKPKSSATMHEALTGMRAQIA